MDGGGALPFIATAILAAVVLQGVLPTTPGKLLFGLELVRRSDGAVVGPRRRGARAVLALICNALGGLGTAWILASPRQQALYDVLAGTALTRRPSR